MAGYNLDKSGRSPADEKRLKAKRRGQTTTKKTDISSKSGFSDLKKRKKVRFGVGSSKTVNGKANVSADQLKKTGMSLRQYMNAWNKSDKRPTTMGTVKKVDSPVRRKDKPISKEEARKLRLTGDRTKLKKVKSPVERKGTPVKKVKSPVERKGTPVKKVDSPVDRPLGRGDMRKAVSKTISDRRKAELRSRKQPVMQAEVTRGPGSGDKLDQPVRAGRDTRGPGSGDTSGQPVKAGSVREAREARGETAATFRKRLREALRKKDKKAGGGRIKVAGYKAGGRVKKSIDGVARKGKTKARHR